MQEVTTPLAEGSKGKAGKVREKLLGPTLSWGLQSWKRKRPVALGPRAPGRKLLKCHSQKSSAMENPGEGEGFKDITMERQARCHQQSLSSHPF